MVKEVGFEIVHGMLFELKYKKKKEEEASTEAESKNPESS